MTADESPQAKSETPIRARHFRAPQGDKEALILPADLDVPALLRRKRRLRSEVGTTLGSNPWFFRQDRDRIELLNAALAYTLQYRDHFLAHTSLPHLNLILAGHQPELFHPGVWLKNFVLSDLAKSRECVAINLIVDNDTTGQSSIRIPSGDLQTPGTHDLQFDTSRPAIPYEDCQAVSPELVSTFPERLRNQFPSKYWFDRETDLLAEQVWRYVQTSQPSSQNAPLGELIARARHRMEQDIGLETLELPLSHVAQTVGFRSFALTLMWKSQGFQATYNRSLFEYREVNKIRSKNHPVPQLARDGEWCEMPFWIWTTENPRRQRLFVNYSDSSTGSCILRLSDRAALNHSFEWGGDHTPNVFELWSELEARGIKIRPRALITTMYARLFLSDLFIHGIGGAKYDELTDAIIRRFFGIEPPEYLTVTGTVRLPIPRPSTTAADVRNVKQLIREIRFHPERFVNDASPAIRESAAQFSEKKKALLREHQFHFRGATPEQFRALDDLNRQLSVLLADVEIRLRDELKSREREAHDNKLLGSREFSFVLHPADELPEQLKRMAQGTHAAPS